MSKRVLVFLLVAASSVATAQSSDPCAANPLCISNTSCDFDPRNCSSWPPDVINPAGMSLPGGGASTPNGNYATPKPSSGSDPGTISSPGPGTPLPAPRTYDPAGVASVLQNNLTQQCKSLSPGLMSSQVNAQGATATLSTPAANLTVGQASAQPMPTVANLSNTEPVGASGEFFSSDTDLTFAGYGIDFTFRRFYRSGSNVRSLLGPGWSHSFRQFIVQGNSAADSPACPPSLHPDVFYIDDASSRHRLVYQPTQSTPSSLLFRDPQDTGLTVVGAAGSWTLDRAGDALTYRFDGLGQLQSIADRLGHQIQVTWEYGYVSRVVDTTGRSIYFVVQGTPRVLTCLSLTKDDCTSALVRFDYNTAPGTFAYLMKVTDAEGRIYRKYRYWNQSASAAEVKSLLDSPTMPSALVEPTCQQFCGKKAADCRNLDRCEAIAQAAQNAMCPSAPFGCPWTARYGECQSIQKACLNDWPIQRVRDQFPDCQAQCFSQCRQQLAPPNQATWVGRPADLLGNLLEVSDGVNNIIVRNTYGEDPTKLDFDRVVTHQQNLSGRLFAALGAKPNVPRRPRPDAFRPADSTQSFAYHDLLAEQTAKVTTPQVTSLGNWKPISLCPCVVPIGGPKDAHCTVRDPVLGTLAAQNVRYAVVIQDLGGVTKTQYFDAFWRLLRSVNLNTNEQEDYNYGNGQMTAERNAVGQRICRQYNAQNLPTRITTLAAPGRPGDGTSKVTTYDYNAHSELISVISNPDGNQPRGNHLLRDDLGRIVAVGRLVDPSHTDWSCANYSDELRVQTAPNSLPPARGPPQSTPAKQGPQLAVPVPSVSTPARAPITPTPSQSAPAPAPLKLPSSPAPQPLGLDGDPRPPFTRSGCYFTANRSSLPNKNWRAVIPSKLTNPAGMVTLQAPITVGGPLNTTVDATGPDPIFAYSKFDDFGRQLETGHQDAQSHYLVGSRRTVTYDRAGLTQTVETDDMDGTPHKTTMAYDNARYVASVTDERSVLTMQHDGFGEVLQQQRAALTPGTATQTTCTQYDALGRLVRRLRPEGELEQRTYDPSGHLQQIMNGWPGAQPEVWALGCTANVARNAMEELVSFTYDAGGMPSSQRQHGIETQVVVDGFGRVIDEIHPYKTGSYGTPTGQRKIAPVASHTVRGYDVLDQMRWVAVYESPPPDYARPTTSRPGLLQFTAYDYDGLGRPTTQTRWNLSTAPTILYAVTTIAYDDVLNRVTTTDEDGIVTAVTLDGLGRKKQMLSAVARPEQQGTTFSYANGGAQVTATTQAPTSTGTVTTTSAYSPRGELLTVADSSGTLLSQTFHNGVVTYRQERARGNFQYTYDAFWRPQQIQNEDLTTIMGYDREDRNTTLKIDTALYARSYDPFDRILLEKSPLGTTSRFYPKGQAGVSRVTDPSRITHDYQYDLSGRPTLITTTDGTKPPVAQTFGYSALDQLVSAERVVAGNAVANAWTYDSLGRALTETSPVGKVTFVYGALKRAATINAGAETTAIVHQRDGLGHPTLVTVDGAPFASMQYKTGALTQLTHESGTTQTFAYDDRAMPRQLKLTSLARNNIPASTTLELDQTYDIRDVPNQRKVQIGQTKPVYDLFESDKRGRVAAEILNAQSPNWDATLEHRYIWGPQSNWRERRGKDAVKATVNGASQLLALGPLSFTYDLAGNVTKAAQRTLTWTPLGELESVTENGRTTKYTYDALSRPITVDDGQKLLESTLWSSNQRAAIVDPTGLRAVIYASPSIALGDIRPKSKRRTYLYPSFDGSTIAASEQTAAPEIYRYSAFGEDTIGGAHGSAQATSTLVNRFRFQGQYRDPISLYYHLGARHYAANLGRFLSTDPLGSTGGVNPYVYVDGMPLTMSDPTGLSSALSKNDASARQTAARDRLRAEVNLQEIFTYDTKTRDRLREELKQQLSPAERDEIDLNQPNIKVAPYAFAATNGAGSAANSSDRTLPGLFAFNMLMPAVAFGGMLLGAPALISTADGATIGRLMPVLMPAGGKISQMMGDWGKAGGEGGYEGFKLFIENFVQQARIAGTYVQGPVYGIGYIQVPGTIYRVGSYYLLQGSSGKLISMVLSGRNFGWTLQYLSLGGKF